MAKKIVLSLLFSFFVAIFFMLNAANLNSASAFLTDTCEAPPPDSFRILDAGAHFVTLAWNPVDPLASYTIIVQKENGSANTWENVDTFSNVTGSSITIQNLLYGSKYQFELATNCENGDPSKLKIYAGPPIGVILDLVLNGRTPANPVSVPNCQAIEFENFNWVGFKVSAGQNLGSTSNFFEFGIGIDGVPIIKRVKHGPDIVATDFNGVFPLNPPGAPIVELIDYKFLIKRVDGPLPLTIGEVSVFYNPGNNPKTVSFCKKNSDWSPGYTFTPMTATLANGLIQSGDYDFIRAEKALDNDFRILNPISDFISIGLDSTYPENSEYSIYMIDLSGRIIFQSNGTAQEGKIEVFAGNIPKGIYAMTLIIDELPKTYKIIKN